MYRSANRYSIVRYYSIIRYHGNISSLAYVTKNIHQGAWQDHCNVTASHSSLIIEENKDDKTLLIRSNSTDLDNITVVVPEYFDLDIIADTTELAIKGKIQGNTSIKMSGGNVTIDKLRGESIFLDCGSANIITRKSLEGDITVKCLTFTTKMINSNNSIIYTLNGCKIGSLFSKYSIIKSNNNIDISNTVGNLEANSIHGNITVGGIEGSFAVTSNSGYVDLHINKLHNSTSSYAIAEKGEINALVDPELKARIECKAGVSNNSTEVATGRTATVISDAFEATPFQQNLENKNNAANCYSGYVVCGVLTGSSNSPKRPIFRNNNSKSGKIALDGAEESWRSNSSNDSSLRLIACNNIRLETLSWIQAIRRRHGLHSDSNNSNSVGRTASASKRLEDLLQYKNNMK